MFCTVFWRSGGGRAMAEKMREDVQAHSQGSCLLKEKERGVLPGWVTVTPIY